MQSSLTPPENSLFGLPFGVPFIRWANQVLYSPGTTMYPRRIYDHEFVYVMAGCGEIVIEGQSYPAAMDSLFLIQPRAWHSFRATKQERAVYLGVHFDWLPQSDTAAFTRFRAAENPIEEGLFRTPQGVPGWDLGAQPFLDLKGRPRVRRLLEDVIAEYARDDAMALGGAGALLAAAIAQMSREAVQLQKRGLLSHVGPDAIRRVERARALLETPRETPLSIEEVAQHVGWSADHLRRMFRAVLDVSPNQIQTAARMRRAKELLRYEHLPIYKVAEQCGFDDPSHFARVFKQESGMSPRQFLSLIRKDG